MSIQDHVAGCWSVHVELVLKSQHLVIVALVLLAVFVVPRAIVHGATTLSWDVHITEGPPDSVIRAPANQHLPPGAPPFFGDFWVGIKPVYPVGQSGGASVGTFYFLSVATALPPDFAGASNHLYAMSRLEIVGKGSLDMNGTFALVGKSYHSLVGGTGAYVGASGECVQEIVSDTIGRVTCQLR